MAQKLITKFDIQPRGSKAIDVRELVENVQYESDINYTAGVLTFDLLAEDSNFAVKNGSAVMFQWEGKKVFYGYIFKWSYDSDGKVNVTAYDKLRYFKNNDSVVFKAGSLASRFTTCVSRASIKGKIVSASSRKLKAVVHDNKSYFEMLKDSIDKVRTAEGKRYFLRDNYGTVELCKVPFKKLDIILDDKTSVITYSFSRSIENTANAIKIVTDDKKKSSRKTATATSSGTVKKWGKLTYVDSVNKKVNSAQMKDRAEALLKQKNKQQNELKLTVLGDVNFIAGNEVKIKINKLKSAGFNSPSMLIVKATHKFGIDYSVDLEMKV